MGKEAVTITIDSELKGQMEESRPHDLNKSQWYEQVLNIGLTEVEGNKGKSSREYERHLIKKMGNIMKELIQSMKAPSNSTRVKEDEFV